MRDQLRALDAAANSTAEHLEALAGFCTASMAWLEQVRDATKKQIDEHVNHLFRELAEMRQRLREEVQELRGPPVATDVIEHKGNGEVVPFAGQKS